MGLLNKLFKKQPMEEKQTKEKIEIEIDSLVPWLLETNKENISSINTELSERWAELLDLVSYLEYAIKELEKAKFEPTDKTYSAINMTKDLFAKKSQLLKKIPKSSGITFTEMRSTCNKTFEIINEIKDANEKQAYVISNYFKKEADNIIKNLKSIEQVLNSFDKKLQGCTILKLIDDVREKLGKRNELLGQLKETEKLQLEISMEINKHNASFDAQKKELREISSDAKWDELYKTKSELEKTEHEIGRIKSGLISDISSIRRPMKKLIHDSENLMLTKEQKTVFSEGAETENVEIIYSVLESLNPIISSKSLDLKENELENIAGIKKKIESGEIIASRNQYRRLFENKAILESKYSSLKAIEEIKSQKESEIKSIEADLANAKNEAEKAGKEKNLIKEGLEKQKAEIRELVLAGSGKEVVLTEEAN